MNDFAALLEKTIGADGVKPPRRRRRTEDIPSVDPVCDFCGGQLHLGEGHETEIAVVEIAAIRVSTINGKNRLDESEWKTAMFCHNCVGHPQILARIWRRAHGEEEGLQSWLSKFTTEGNAK